MAFAGQTKLRYPGGDPENGPAYLQKFNGRVWVCAAHDFREDSDDELDDEGRPTGATYTFTACRHCGELGGSSDG